MLSSRQSGSSLRASPIELPRVLLASAMPVLYTSIIPTDQLSLSVSRATIKESDCYQAVLKICLGVKVTFVPADSGDRLIVDPIYPSDSTSSLTARKTSIIYHANRDKYSVRFSCASSNSPHPISLPPHDSSTKLGESLLRSSAGHRKSITDH